MYPGANVIEFPGEKSYWVRIRPQGDDRDMAEYIAQHTSAERRQCVFNEVGLGQRVSMPASQRVGAVRNEGSPGSAG